MAIPSGRLTSTNKGRTRLISLRGGPELMARLEALDESFVPIGKRWQREAIEVGRPRIPQRTGATRRSLRAGAIGEKVINNRGSGASRLQARVLGSYIAYFIDSGVKPHAITPRHANTLAWQGSAGTIFAKSASHPGYRKRPFRARMSREGLRRTPMAQELIDQWNGAA
jgi:hypothetical protein